MVKLKCLNKNFFKKKAKVVLVTTGIGIGIIASISINPLYLNIGKLDYNEIEFKTYSQNELIQLLSPEANIDIEPIIESDDYRSHYTNFSSMTASNEIKVRFDTNFYNADYFRIGITEENEISSWHKMPKDGLITIYRNDFSDSQFGKIFYIEFGGTNKTDGEIVPAPGNSNYGSIESVELFCTDTTKEKLENDIHVKNYFSEEVSKLIDENMNDYEKVKIIYDYIIDKLSYDRVTDKEGRIIEVSDEMNISKNKFITDCTGYADIFYYLCKSTGLECMVVVDDVNGHVWNIVKIDNKYYHIDATYSDTGSFYNTEKYKYFLVSDNVMQSENRVFVSEKDVICDRNYNLPNTINSKKHNI